MSIKPPQTAWKVNRHMYAAWRAVLCFLAHFLYKYRLVGSENVPQEGPIILAFNHLHMFDTIVMAPVTKRQVVPFAADKWRDRGIAGWLLKQIGSIFIKRGEVDRQALKDSFKALDSGYPLVIAPEGTRSKTSQMQMARPGIAFIAQRDRVPIVPVAQWGVERIGEWKHLRRPVCHVVVGEPFYLPQLQKPSTAQLQALSDLIMLKIALNLPESYRGVYAERTLAIESGEDHALDVLEKVESQA